MATDSINKFILKHKNPDKIAERISIFETVRDFEYQINWVSEPEKLLEIKEWYCTSKHRLLKEIYERLGYKAQLCFIPFSFNMIYLPDELKNRWYANKKWYHTFLQMLIDGKWIDIDATFNKELKNIYTVNENRNWFSPQRIICKYDKVYIPKSVEEELEVKTILCDRNWLDEDDKNWIWKYNNRIKSF